MQICSSFFNDQMIKVIANVIKASIQKISQIQVRKTQELGTLEGRPVILPTEDTLQVVSLNYFASYVLSFSYVQIVCCVLPCNLLTVAAIYAPEYE